MNELTLGQFLSSLRKSKGYTQQNVADALNVSNKTVSGWERDVAMPDANFIPLLAELYGVSCDEILRGRKETPVPYGQRSDALTSRLFVSTFSAQKITNAIIRTIVASLFLAGGHIITLILVAGGNRDNYGLYYCLTLPFTAISVAITLTGYFATDFPLRQSGKEFTALRKRLLNITRGALAAEIACPFLWLPLLFASDNEVNNALFGAGFLLLTALPLFFTDSLIRYCNKDLYPKTRSVKAELAASVTVFAIVLCVLASCLPVIYGVKYSSEDVYKAQTEFESYSDLVQTLCRDPLEKYATSKTYIKTEDNKTQCVYTFPKDADISELLRSYPEYELYRLPDRNELRISYETLTISRKVTFDGVEQTLITSVVLTDPDHLYVSYVEERDGKFVTVSPLDSTLARKRLRDLNDLAAGIVVCAAAVVSAIAIIVATLICKKKIKE